MMYKLLIVDDEPLIANNLYALFHEETAPALEVFIAYSAKDALKIIRERKIDILLTDIMMPDMDGLQLQAAAITLWPEIKVIFLTGASEFLYVKMGLRMGGVDYVTKSEDDQVIVSAVEVAVAMLDAEVEKRHQLVASRIRSKLFEPLRRSYFLERAVNGDEPIDRDSNDMFRSMDIPLKPDKPLLLLVMQTFVSADSCDALYEIGELIDNVVARDAWTTWFLYGHRLPVFFLQPRRGDDPVSWSALAQSVENALAPLQHTIRKAYHAPAAFLLVRDPFAYSELPSQFYQARRTLARASGDDRDALVIKPKFSISHNDGASERAMDMLLALLEENDCEGYLASLSSLAKQKPDALPEQLEISFRLCAMNLSYLNRAAFSKEKRMRLTDQLLLIAHHLHEWEVSMEKYRRFAEDLFRERELRIDEERNRLFAFVEDYALSHLHEDLSLNRMAELVHFHPVYFSRIFKTATGKTYSTFISEIRLSRAKRLLSDPQIRIMEISKMLGFENPSYFSRFFKRLTGVTPQNFRNPLD